MRYCHPPTVSPYNKIDDDDNCLELYFFFLEQEGKLRIIALIEEGSVTTPTHPPTPDLNINYICAC